MAEVTTPIITDDTGQSIASAIIALGATLGSDRALIDGSNIANPSAFRSAIGVNDIRVATVTGTVNTSAADASTIGYRSTSSDAVNITSLSGYPSGKTILAYIVDYAYCSNGTQLALLDVYSNYIYANSKTATTVHFSIKILYIN